MKYYVRAYTFLALFAGVIVALDQWTKSLVRANIPMGSSWMPWEWLEPYARVVHWYNTGVAFGMFQGQNLIFSILAIIVSLVIIFYFPQVPEQEPLLRVALGMQLAGAVGNLIDRVTIGHVTDFVSVGTFPVFNVADASITVGCAILLLTVYMQDRRQRKAKAVEAAEPVEQNAKQDESEFPPA